MTDETNKYLGSWEKLRRLQRLLWVVPGVGFLITLALIPMINEKAVPAKAGVALILGIAFVTFFLFVRFVSWRCPRWRLRIQMQHLISFVGVLLLQFSPAFGEELKTGIGAEAGLSSTLPGALEFGVNYLIDTDARRVSLLGSYNRKDDQGFIGLAIKNEFKNVLLSPEFGLGYSASRYSVNAGIGQKLFSQWSLTAGVVAAVPVGQVNDALFGPYVLLRWISR